VKKIGRTRKPISSESSRSGRSKKGKPENKKGPRKTKSPVCKRNPGDHGRSFSISVDLPDVPPEKKKIAKYHDIRRYHWMRTGQERTTAEEGEKKKKAKNKQKKTKRGQRAPVAALEKSFQ